MPIPTERDAQWSQNDPRPQEATAVPATGAQAGQGQAGLEQELQGGLDAMQH